MPAPHHLLIPYAASRAPGAQEALKSLALPHLDRLLAGENVTQAHRSHLYQLLNRSGHSHRRVSQFHVGMAVAQGLAALVGDVASITTSGALASRIDAFRGADARLFAVESRWAGGGTYETFTVTRQPAAVYLGEPCSTATPCADNLRCERSGNAQAARCALSLP